MKSKSISIIRVCFFTEKAGTLFEKLKASLPEIVWLSMGSKKDLLKWTKDSFEKSLPLLFISAAGIAVRSIAPFVKDKTADSPVLVMDEDGKFIIPVLSGHLGNANTIAKLISDSIKAQAVITTGTDVNGKFSIDNFAKRNGFRIVNREGIKTVSSKVLSGKKIGIFIEDSIAYTDTNISDEIFITKEYKTADVVITTNGKNIITDDKQLQLVLKNYSIGMGCKKGKSFEELYEFAEKTFSNVFNCRLLDEAYNLSSIDLKEKEMGLMELSHYLHVPYLTYSAEELMTAEGDFSKSEFVQETTGVSNVCERAAVLSAGPKGKLILKKTLENGMTIAVAQRCPAIKTWTENF